MISRKNAVQNGYVVIYTEAKKQKTINVRFANMADYSGAELVQTLKPDCTPDEDGWIWDTGVFSIIQE